MTDSRQTQKHEEIDLLLPWYVNDTLEPVDHDRVAKHVATCTECQESVSLLAEVQAAVLKDKATPIVPQPRVDQLLASIGRDSRSGHGGRQQLRTYLAAAAVTLLLIATLLLTNPDGDRGILRQYETATSHKNGTTMDYVLAIQFEPDTSPTDRDRVMQDIGARDVSGGSDEGSYRVIVQLSASSLEELASYTENLQSLPEISSVSVTALQLPMRPQQ